MKETVHGVQGEDSTTTTTTEGEFEAWTKQMEKDSAWIKLVMEIGRYCDSHIKHR
jgi:hypothetical protein